MHHWCRAAAGAAIALAALACGGAHDAPLPVPSARHRAKWPHLDAARSWERVRGPMPSRGHAPRRRYSIEIRVAPASAATAYRQLVPGSVLAPGARVAAFHRSSGGAASSVYVMEKSAGGWSFTVVDPDGTLARGSVERCASCHADAPADSLFGPRLPEESEARE